MQGGLVALAAALLWSSVASMALADQNDPRLDNLFDRLQTTRDSSEAERIERRIWRIWTETDNSIARRLMGEGLRAMATSRLNTALDRFDRTVAVAPRFAEAWNKRATVHYQMGDYGASVRDIQRALDLEPRHFGALSGLGMIYDALDEKGAALRSFEAALEVNPHLEDAQERVDQLRRRVRGRET